MLAARMIPAIWFRLVVLIVFAAFTWYQELTWVAMAAIALAFLSVVQLVFAYRQRAEMHEKETRPNT